MTIQTGLVQPAPPSLAWLKKSKNTLIDLLFPPHCVTCHSLGAWFCTGCTDRIEAIHPPLCHLCGLPIDVSPTRSDTELCCRRCKQTPLQLDGLRAYAFHSEPLRQAIHEFKYRDLWSLSSRLGELMGKAWVTLAPTGLELDAIVPVPLHPSRQRQRGFNQAGLLAAELATQLQCPAVQDVLVRTRATAPQVDLNSQERKANVQNAFHCTGPGLAGKSVLLVDDVCTTGATLEAACAAMREAGTSSVWAYTLARARPGPRSTQATPRHRPRAIP